MGNPTFQNSKRCFTVVRAALLLCLLIGNGMACAVTPVSSGRDESDSVIGKPPPADTDPFAVITLPADAMPVAHQGTIDVEEPKSSPPMVDEDVVDEVVVDEKVAIKAEVVPTTPTPLPADERPAGQSACFSCVQICSAENSSSDCNNAPQDMVCGWGTAPDIEQAREVAQAQCNATLDMARQMPMYSRIEGNCPPASCR